jgi:hypothetical protein
MPGGAERGRRGDKASTARLMRGSGRGGEGPPGARAPRSVGGNGWHLPHRCPRVARMPLALHVLPRGRRREYGLNFAACLAPVCLRRKSGTTYPALEPGRRESSDAPGALGHQRLGDALGAHTPSIVQFCLYETVRRIHISC